MTHHAGLEYGSKPVARQRERAPWRSRARSRPGRSISCGRYIRKMTGACATVRRDGSALPVTLHARRGTQASVARRCSVCWIVILASWSAIDCARTEPEPARTLMLAVAGGEPVIPVQTYKAQLSGVRSRNPDVKLSVGHDPALGEEPVLLVTYPGPTDDPAGRDVWCDAENQDWSGGRAVTFSVKPDQAIKLSVSFPPASG